MDPLDGSYNYLRGLPECCVSIGLWRDGAAVLGVVYDFTRGEMFTGIAGTGAWLNGRRISVSRTAKLSSAALCTGSPCRSRPAPSRQAAMPTFRASMPTIRPDVVARS